MSVEQPATAARVLAAAADHMERVGLYQGERLWQPGKPGESAPCTMLHAWDQGVRAVKPRWSIRDEELWSAFHRALRHSLVVLSDHLNGRPVPPTAWRHLRMVEDAYRRIALWCWGDEPGRTTEEAVEAFRAAAALCGSDREHVDRN
ncbi:DUF6197 family protein [Streptomyces sp. NPDC127108]|uniref:DUF6197 family protein n=1 Tax=Streptomyces sp. NPDC127108 TaxID=3345361 RepID=UPI00363B2A7E